MHMSYKNKGTDHGDRWYSKGGIETYCGSVYFKDLEDRMRDWKAHVKERREDDQKNEQKRINVAELELAFAKQEIWKYEQEKKNRKHEKRLNALLEDLTLDVPAAPKLLKEFEAMAEEGGCLVKTTPNGAPTNGGATTNGETPVVAAEAS